MASSSLPCKFKALCLSASSSPSSSRSRNAFNSLGFSASLLHDVFSGENLDGHLPIPQAGFILNRLLVSNGEKNPPHFSITCEATPTKRRIYNKAHKSEIRTRMKKCAKSLVAREKSARQVLWWLRGLSVVVITPE
ncbi:hypothetical protein ACJRO7_031873 [Eucalyptus globulus]|uniref:Uncharacterized protein n=1 Tax=Eucalyptus globulus TaxID=34317 RepID=A0ABD3JIQ8_EUCGL